MNRIKSIFTEKIFVIYGSRSYLSDFYYNGCKKTETDFLIFDNKWIWVSADGYIPLEELSQ